MTDPELFPKDATDATGAANAAVAASLPLDDPTDRGLAERGRVATGSVRQIPGPGVAGNVVWDLDVFAFLDGEAPPTVNPSLWRQAQLNTVARPVRGRRRHLPGARLRPLERHVHRAATPAGS